MLIPPLIPPLALVHFSSQQLPKSLGGLHFISEQRLSNLSNDGPHKSMVERTIISAFNRLIRKKMAYTQGRSIAATIKHGQHNDEAVVLAGI